MSRRDSSLTGLEIGPVTEQAFLDFAGAHGTSPEIGRIATCLDADREAPHAPSLLGVRGCGKLCGVVCALLQKSKSDGSVVVKLDSVIVDPKLRKRGLAGLLVARVFAEALERTGDKISAFYAHTVHPASVRLLHRLSFSEPALSGAPISWLGTDEEARLLLLAQSRSQSGLIEARLKLQCAFCRTADRRATPWCLPRHAKRCDTAPRA